MRLCSCILQWVEVKVKCVPFYLLLCASRGTSNDGEEGTMSDRQNTQVYSFDPRSPRINAFQIHEWIHENLQLEEADVQMIQIDGPRRRVYIKFTTNTLMYTVLNGTQGCPEFNTLPSGHEKTRYCSPMCCWRVTSFLVFLHDVLHMHLSAGLAHFSLQGYRQLNAGCLSLKLQINRPVLTPYL
jgi:hypothetical protein